MTQTIPPLPPAGQLPPTDTLAIWALVLGIANFVCCIPFVPAILAIVLGRKSKAKILASGGTLTGEGMARAAVILGWVGIALDIVGIIVGVIIGLAMVISHS